MSVTPVRCVCQSRFFLSYPSRNAAVRWTTLGPLAQVRPDICSIATPVGVGTADSTTTTAVKDCITPDRSGCCLRRRGQHHTTANCSTATMGTCVPEQNPDHMPEPPWPSRCTIQILRPREQASCHHGQSVMVAEPCQSGVCAVLVRPETLLIPVKTEQR